MAVRNQTARNRRSLHKRQKQRSKRQTSLNFEKLEPRQMLNATPLANHDLGYTTAINTTLTVSLTTDGVLDNDFDAEGATLTASKGDDPSHGSLTFNSNGTFTYIPDTGFEGVDTFTYDISDGTNTSVEATAQVTVGDGLSGMLNGNERSSGLLHDGVLAVNQPIGSGLELSYRSDTIPVALVPIETMLTAGTSIPDTIEAELTIDSVSSGVISFSNTALATGEPLRFALRSLTTSSATGMYDWTIEVTLKYSGSADIDQTFTGSSALVNRSNSEFGSGWWINGLDQLYDSTAGALLVNGDGTTLWFEKDGGTYNKAEGDLTFSTLVENGGGDFTLTDKWGDERNFDSDGYLTDIQLLNNTNASFTFAYDGSNRLEEITDEFGREATFTYHSTTEKLESLNDFYGRETNFTVTSGDLFSLTLSDETATGYTAPTWDFAYTTIGGESYLNEITDPADETTEFLYNTASRRLKQINNADHTGGDPSSWKLYPTIEQGLATTNGTTMLKVADMDARYVDENANEFGFTTDRFGNVISTTDALDAVTQIDINDQGLVYQITGADPDGGGSQTSPVTKFGYNDLGDMVFTEYADGESTTATFHSSLHLITGFTNELGKSTSSTYFSDGDLDTYTDEGGNDWSYTYDTYGNILTETSPDPDGAGTTYSEIETTYTYDATYYRRLTIITWDNGEDQVFSYTSSDQVLTFTDELGHFTGYEYDPLDRVTKMTRPDPGWYAPLVSPAYTYSYGSNLLLESEIDAEGNETQYEYNARNWLTKITLEDPDDAGSLTSPEYTFTYGKTGLLTSETRPEFVSVSLDYEYDDNGRLTEITGPVSSSQETLYAYDDLGRVTTITDASDRVVTYEYDARNRLVKIIDHDPDGAGSEVGPTTEFGYDVAGQLTSQTDPLERETSYTYYDTGWLKTETTPDPDRAGDAPAPVNEYEYDAIGRLTKTIDQSERFTTNEYNIYGQVTKFTNLDPDGPDDPLTATYDLFEYDVVGNLTSFTDVLSNETEYEYDELDRLVTLTLPDPDGAGSKTSPVTTFTYDDVDNLLTRTNANSETTTYTYDNLYRQLTVTLPDPDGAGSQTAPVWSFSYNSQALLDTTTDPLSHDTTRDYDSAGRLTDVTNAGSNTTEYAYDLMNRVVTITTPDPDGGGAQTASETDYTYDVYSRLTAIEDAAGETTTRNFDIAGQLLSLVDSEGNTTRWAYDERGRMTMETDERGYTFSNFYSSLDRLVLTNDRLDRVTNFVNDGYTRSELWYERSDMPTSTAATTTEGGTGVNEVQTITLDNLTTGSSGGGGGGPGGGPGGGGSSPSDIFRIAFDGQVAVPLEADATAADVEAALEGLEAIDNVTVTESSGVFTITFVGDLAETDVPELMTDVLAVDNGSLVNEMTFDRDNLYRTTTAEDDFASYDFTYDNLGRITSTTEDITGLTPDVVLDYDYDSMGYRTSVAATLGANLDYLNDYTYDDLNRLVSIEQQDQSGGNKVADKQIDYTFNALGQTTEINRYEALTGSNPALRTVFQYDTANRLSSLSHKKVTSGGTATVLHTYTYSYDAVDRFTSIVSTIDGTSSYTFDKLNQLTDADHASGRTDEDFNYDSTGNRSGSGYTVGDDNLTTSDGTYDFDYDAAGNRIRRTEISSGDYDEYTWDHRNRLTLIESYDSSDTLLSTVEYAYDVFNRMVKRTYDSDGPLGGNAAVDQYFAGFDGIHPTFEFDGAADTDLTHRMLWNGHQLISDEIVTSLTTEGDVLWALADHVGTIRDIGKWDSGTSAFKIANHRVYDSFGNLESETDSSVDLAYGFTGQWTDDVTEMTHNLHRWYDPTIGKWLSDDPISFSAGDVNLQRYVGNRPMTFVDPVGLAYQELTVVEELNLDNTQGQTDEEPSWVWPTDSRASSKVAWEPVLDTTQGSLDVAGLSPGVGVAPDLLNAGIYGLRGDWFNFKLSLLCAAPVAGWFFGGAKVIKNGNKLLNAAEIVVKSSDEAADVVKTVTKASDYGLTKIIETASGMKTGAAGEFFGWQGRVVTKNAGEFTKDQLIEKGFNKKVLEQMAEAYENIAKTVSDKGFKNLSAPSRAVQLRKIIGELF